MERQHSSIRWDEWRPLPDWQSQTATLGNFPPGDSSLQPVKWGQERGAVTDLIIKSQKVLRLANQQLPPTHAAKAWFEESLQLSEWLANWILTHPGMANLESPVFQELADRAVWCEQQLQVVNLQREYLPRIQRLILAIRTGPMPSNIELMELLSELRTDAAKLAPRVPFDVIPVDPLTPEPVEDHRLAMHAPHQIGMFGNRRQGLLQRMRAAREIEPVVQDESDQGRRASETAFRQTLLLIHWTGLTKDLPAVDTERMLAAALFSEVMQPPREVAGQPQSAGRVRTMKRRQAELSAAILQTIPGFSSEVAMLVGAHHRLTGSRDTAGMWRPHTARLALVVRFLELWALHSPRPPAIRQALACSVALWKETLRGDWQRRDVESFFRSVSPEWGTLVSRVFTESLSFRADQDHGIPAPNYGKAAGRGAGAGPWVAPEMAEVRWRA